MKRNYVDASAFITLSAIDRLEILSAIDGEPIIPRSVAAEINGEPESTQLERAVDAGWLTTPDERIRTTDADCYRRATTHLNRNSEAGEFDGDVALLAAGLRASSPSESAGEESTTERKVTVITDDKPLRNACKTLDIPVSGSIGVVISGVERNVLEPDAAKDAILAMDEVGARLSASLLRRAERLIDDAAADS